MKHSGGGGSSWVADVTPVPAAGTVRGGLAGAGSGGVTRVPRGPFIPGLPSRAGLAGGSRPHPFPSAHSSPCRV